MYQIYSGSTGVLSVQIRSLNEAGRYSWMSEAEAIDEYQKQKKRYPYCPLVVIEHIYQGKNRIVIDDRLSS
jgi:hypothetical protein